MDQGGSMTPPALTEPNTQRDRVFVGVSPGSGIVWTPRAFPVEAHVVLYYLFEEVNFSQQQRVLIKRLFLQKL